MLSNVSNHLLYSDSASLLTVSIALKGGLSILFLMLLAIFYLYYCCLMFLICYK